MNLVGCRFLIFWVLLCASACVRREDLGLGNRADAFCGSSYWDPVRGMACPTQVSQRLNLNTGVPILGSANFDGAYFLPVADSKFLQGARHLLETGSKLIKFNLRYRDYWGEPHLAVSTPATRLLEHPSMKAVFAMPFDVYVMWTYRADTTGDSYWTQALLPEDLDAERDLMQSMCEQLIARFHDTQKVFVLTHYEGDWLLGSPVDVHQDPSDQAIKGMIAWLNARHEGLERCRQSSAYQQSYAQVFDAVEVNRVRATIDNPNAKRMINSVVPHVNFDLLSYSAWDATERAHFPPVVAGGRLRAALEESLAQIKRYVRASPVFGEHNIYLGEFGFPENDLLPLGFDDSAYGTLYGDVHALAISERMPFAAFWQVYTNECSDTNNAATCRGFWMVDPQGRPKAAYEVFQRRNHASRFVSSLYQQYLHRFAEADALEAGVARLDDNTQYVVFLDETMNSAEARRVLDDDAFVDRLYRSVKGRLPDADEHAFLLGRLSFGTRSQLRDYLWDRLPNALLSTKEALVEELFISLLGRLPATWELDDWKARLDRQSYSKVVRAMLVSPLFVNAQVFNSGQPHAVESVAWFPNR